MARQALGLIETIGLAAAVTAADAAVKAANVKLLGYEFAKGGGLTTIKLFGDVGAVTAAVAAGKAEALKVNTVFASHVIPRPHQYVDSLLFTKDTVGWQKEDSGSGDTKAVASPEQVETAAELNEPAVSESLDAAKEETGQAESEESEKQPDSEPKEAPELQKNPEDLCNLCADPACERRKGEPRVNCIHYDEHKNREES